MALAMWARTAAGTNLSFVKGFGKAVKSWREVLQQVLRKPTEAPRAKAQKALELSRIDVRERYLFRPILPPKTSNNLQSRVFRSIFSRTTSKSLASELRRISALRLSSSSARNFRNVPLMSLIGVTLGLNVSSALDDGAEKMMTEMREMFRGYTWQTEPLEKLPQSLKDLDINLESIASGCEGAVYKAKVKADEANTMESSSLSEEHSDPDADYNLALKAVFNYGAESNAGSIIRALEREMVPLRDADFEFESELGTRVNRVPPHPNIVDMPGIFVDDMLVTEEGLQKFPAAMPRRLNADIHFGRSKTLYLVMRRRITHLRDYLATHDVPMVTRCLMLAQLLEGVSHLGKHGIAHRDLKTDNVLVDLPQNGGPPRLEICDFGCCLAEENKSLKIPFPTRDMYMGGNSWLMAPEIATAVPGPSAILNFSKSDLWAAGTMAYEILGAENPFYPSKNNSRKQLSSHNYSQDELPALPDEVPEPLKQLVKALLQRNPQKRPSASVAAAVAKMVVLEATQPPRKWSGDKTRPARAEGKKPLGRKSNPVIFSKEQEKLMWLIAQSLSLLHQLSFGDNSVGWDMYMVMNFLLLSQLTYADLKEVMKFW